MKREMTGRERVRRALRFEAPDRVPRDLWTLPGAQERYREEIRQLLERFPTDFAAPRFAYGPARRAAGTPNRVGRYTDEWGSVWEVKQDGIIGEVKEPVLKDWSDLADLEPPYEMLEAADFSQVNASCAQTDRFVRAGTMVRPFERMQFLRGSEQLFLDLAESPPELWKLRDLVHEFHLTELRLWAETDVDGVSLMDDWGSQTALLISPAQWREFFKPLYADYCRILHAADKFVFFHSDGHIEAIYGDLIEIGVDAINSQLFCMNIERLGRLYRGKVTFWGEIDRQGVLAFGTPQTVREAVRRVRRALDTGHGGVIAQCEWGLDTPPENVHAVFEAWLEPYESLWG